MGAFRVTKYNPKWRLANGSYPVAEWTSVSDVGRAFGGQTVECSDYVRVEDAYVEAVRCFAASWGVGALRVTDLERKGNGRLPPALVDETIQHVGVLSDGAEVSGIDLEWVVRLALRDAIWCRLEGPNGFYVHFGYDYYMYIGSDDAENGAPPLPAGLFAERMASPYHREEDDQS